jgi:hypothetical protein
VLSRRHLDKESTTMNSLMSGSLEDLPSDVGSATPVGRQADSTRAPTARRARGALGGLLGPALVGLLALEAVNLALMLAPMGCGPAAALGKLL